MDLHVTLAEPQAYTDNEVEIALSNLFTGINHNDRSTRRGRVIYNAYQEQIFRNTIRDFSNREKLLLIEVMGHFPPGENWLDEDNVGFYMARRKLTVERSQERAQRQQLIEPIRKILQSYTQWCISTHELLLQWLHLPGVVLAGFLVKSSVREHKGCTYRQCRGLQISKEEEKIPAHITGCSGSEDGCFETPTPNEQLREIISKAQVALAFLPQFGDSCSQEDIQMAELADNQPFVAISYTWAQRRLMPQCQLNELRSWLAELLPADSGRYPIWLDVLCIPQSNDLAALRAKAINRIPVVYEKASQVLVLDDSLLSTSSTDAATSIGLQVLVSDWMRRLWTMEEAMLSSHVPSKLIFRLKDGFVSFLELQERLEEEEGNGWMMGRLISDSLDRLLRIPPNSDITEKLVRLVKSIEYRSTSRKRDEVPCLQFILFQGVGSNELQGHIDWSRYRTLDDRMVQLFLRIAEFPLSIVFLNSRRVQQKNFQWLPRSFVGRSSPRRENIKVRANQPASSDTLIPRYQVRPRNIMASCNEAGLYFEADAEIFSIKRDTTSLFPTLDDNKETEFTTIHLCITKETESSKPSRRTYQTLWKRISKTYWEEDLEAQAREGIKVEKLGEHEGWNQLLEVNSENTLALITSDASNHDGMVLRVKSWHHNEIHAKFLCTVFIGKDDDPTFHKTTDGDEIKHRNELVSSNTPPPIPSPTVLSPPTWRESSAASSQTTENSARQDAEIAAVSRYDAGNIRESNLNNEGTSNRLPRQHHIASLDVSRNELLRPDTWVRPEASPDKTEKKAEKKAELKYHRKKRASIFTGDAFVLKGCKWHVV